MTEDNNSRDIPPAALVIGWLGVVPFAVLATGIIAGEPTHAAWFMDTLHAYAMIILSFMGGAQWGLTVLRTNETDLQKTLSFSASVVPALIAFATVPLQPTVALSILIAGFLALLIYDLWSIKRGHSPRWYGALRLQLTIAVILWIGGALIF